MGLPGRVALFNVLNKGLWSNLKTEPPKLAKAEASASANLLNESYSLIYADNTCSFIYLLTTGVYMYLNSYDSCLLYIFLSVHKFL